MTAPAKITTAAKTQLGSAKPETLHERAREAAMQQRQLLITLSTACLAVFFVTLTGTDASKFGATERMYARAGLAGMGLSVFGGVIALFADARRNYNQARHLQAEEKGQSALSAAFRTRYLRWKNVVKTGNWIQRICFLVGIAAIVAYTFARLAVAPDAKSPPPAAQQTAAPTR
jgi:hypothetical protein